MKTHLIATIAIIPFMAVAIGTTSCIYDAPGDKFYRTLWTTEDPTLGKLTVDFLCDNQISARSDLSSGAYGTYESHALNAEFDGLTLIFDQLVINKGLPSALTLSDVAVHLTDATRNGDLLTIRWHTVQVDMNFTVTLRRLSEYQ